MIKWINQSKELTADERSEVLRRALRCNVYWHQFEYVGINAGTPPNTSFYATKEEIAYDYCITELRGNIGTQSGLYDLSLYDTLTDKTIYGNRETPFPNQFFVNYTLPQDEKTPHLVPRGARIISQITNTVTVAPPIDVKEDVSVVMAGYLAGELNRYLQSDETEAINESMATESLFDIFSLQVTHNTGQKDYIIENDRRPRLILAFAYRQKEKPFFPIGISKINIEDVNENKRLTSNFIEVQYLAPNSGTAKDVTWYYLPVEHYFSPLDSLKLTVAQFPENRDEDMSFEFYVLTRTV